MDKKIFINGRFLTQRITGVQRVAIELTRAIDKIVEPNEIEILSPPGIINEIELKNIKIKIIGKKSNNFWVQCTLPKYVIQNGGVLLTISGMCPIFRLIYSILYRLSLKRCKHIFTVSEFSKNEISSFYNINKDSITVIYNAADCSKQIIKEDRIISELGLNRNDYYLSVGSKSAHKNQSYIYDLAIRNPFVKFVIVGGKVNQSLVGSDSLGSDNIIYTGYLPDEDLKDIYINARGFIFPSFYEGFGIPPLEAIMNGVKHIAVSDIPVFREIYSKGVYFFDPNDVDSFDFKTFNQISISDEDYQFYRTFYSWDRSALICLNKMKMFK